MPNDIVLPEPHEIDNPSFWAAIYDDLLHKMTPTAADEALSVRSGTIAAAIKRNEIEPYQFAERKVYVTPCLLGMWAYKYHRKFQAAKLPS